ncbi:hypothetical protein NBRC10512v2_004972 [Rhodotorula toruloides]
MPRKSKRKSSAMKKHAAELRAAEDTGLQALKSDLREIGEDIDRRMTNPETTSGDPHEEDNPGPQVSIQDATTRLFATLAAESNWSINDDAGSEDEDVEDDEGESEDAENDLDPTMGGLIVDESDEDLPRARLELDKFFDAQKEAKRRKLALTAELYQELEEELAKRGGKGR